MRESCRIQTITKSLHHILMWPTFQAMTSLLLGQGSTKGSFYHWNTKPSRKGHSSDKGHITSPRRYRSRHEQTPTLFTVHHRIHRLSDEQRRSFGIEFTSSDKNSLLYRVPSKLIKKSEKHSLKLLSSLNRFRASGYLCDVTLKIQQRQFHAHKTILASSSPYFEAMFTSCMEESQMSEVEIKGLSDCRTFFGMC